MDGGALPPRLVVCLLPKINEELDALVK